MVKMAKLAKWSIWAKRTTDHPNLGRKSRKVKIAHFDPILGGFDPKNGVKIAKMLRFDQNVKWGPEYDPLSKFESIWSKNKKNRVTHPKYSARSAIPIPIVCSSIAEHTASAGCKPRVCSDNVLQHVIFSILS